MRLSIKPVSLLALGILSLSASAPATAQTFVSTLDNINLALGGLGEGRPFQSAGQTFVLPANHRLDTFEFILQGAIPSSLPFRVNIMAWDPVNQRATGTPLFTSGTNYYDPTAAVQRFRVPTGGLNLAANQPYVAFLNTTQVHDSIQDGAVFWQVATTNPYAGGDLVFQVTGNTFSNVTNATWQTYIAQGQSSPADLGFRLLLDMPYLPNAALGQAVTLVGAFGSNPALASSLTDGIFLPAGTQWQNGTVWWTDINSRIEVNLGGLRRINGYNLQADDNDRYLVEYFSAASNSWVSLTFAGNLVDGPNGMQTRPDRDNPNRRYFFPTIIETDRFRISAVNGDNAFSVSEFQAFGVPAPEPVSLSLVGIGLLAGGLARRRVRRS